MPKSLVHIAESGDPARPVGVFDGARRIARFETLEPALDYADTLVKMHGPRFGPKPRNWDRR